MDTSGLIEPVSPKTSQVSISPLQSSMESVLGFKELPNDVVEDESRSYKLVPWMSWDEWKFVRESLFSSSPDSVASALRRISTWRSRGCIPVLIDVSASIVEIQQKDSFFRDDLGESASESEEMLAMLYCMAIMRLVNCVIERNRKKNEISIGEAADAIGIPRMLIDIRHEGSHRDLPSLQLVRLASRKALDWLVSYYWEPQENAIPIRNKQISILRKKIKRRLHEVALCLKEKQAENSGSSHIKGKQHLYGPGKFLFFVAGKPSNSSSKGYKKQLAKSLKHALKLYSSFSSEVVSHLLEYLLNALDSSNLAEQLEDSPLVCCTEDSQTAFDDWKPVILKLSRKEPDFLLTLTQAVLEKMESNEAMNYGRKLEQGHTWRTKQILPKIDRVVSSTDDHQSPENSAKSRQIGLLSYLFEWLVLNLKTLNPVNSKQSLESKVSKTEKHLSKEITMGLLQRCLLISSPSNKQLMASALTLAQLTGDTSLLQKLRKLSLIDLSGTEDDNPVNFCNENVLSEQEDSIRQAEEKLKLIRQSNKKEEQRDSKVGNRGKWAVAKSWNPCPIGMLPQTIGFSGSLPVLHCPNEELNQSNEHCKQGLGKREAESAVEEMDNTLVKKVKQSELDAAQDQADFGADGVKGLLLIDGVWKEVGEDELFDIASAVRLLV